MVFMKGFSVLQWFFRALQGFYPFYRFQKRNPSDLRVDPKTRGRKPGFCSTAWQFFLLEVIYGTRKKTKDTPRKDDKVTC